MKRLGGDIECTMTAVGDNVVEFLDLINLSAIHTE